MSHLKGGACLQYSIPITTQVHLRKLEYGEKVILIKKVKLSYILDSLHVK